MDYSAISPEELILVCFQTGEESAWVEFIHRFNPLIARVVLRVARQWGETSPQALDDLIQETYLKLCADRENFMQRFKPAHKESIFAYIKVFTANLVHDHFKAARSKKRGGAAVTASLDGTETPHPLSTGVSGPATIERSLLIQEVEACLQAVIPGVDGARDRCIFWLYFRTGLPASEIAALPSVGLSTKGVESTLLRLTRQVRERLVPSGEVKAHGQPPEKGIQPAESL